mmetsp:Transcript_115581/g.331806  ORF Transcript_115581/g.331806 Transcript_115581/m.331806 type:complete len:355 (-) Transcript_115581:288-1352(-)|eukprot:CAMPEP_0170231756 /NCGR_PEP_ID=MMETSP0116_2-20130129/15614_1 /TAXON_ID=400756 /ORGANISM="Durinskia baltica, Strain CSIRO CS-38" /LENGTH=354 /DNA_ID=CAMNT_0010482531 /DNA_START=59 /DNA_END=1123 /DNA_ORIENTATION=-
MGGSSSAEQGAGAAAGGGSGGAAPAAPAPTTSSSGAGHKVLLNIYSPTGGQHAVYHSGVEVLGAEYVFGGGDTAFSGVSAQRPRVPPSGSGWNFYQSVEVGTSRASREEIQRCIAELRSEFPASSYDLLARNCNHFSDALCKRLCGQSIPTWINRAAGLGAAVRGAVGATGAGAVGAPAKAEAGAGGLAATGVIAQSVGADGDLTGQVDWSSSGVLNAREADPSDVLRSLGLISSDEGIGELLLLLPMLSTVKLQAVKVRAPDVARAPSRARLFANQRNLDVDDAAGGIAATQEFVPIHWEPSPDHAGAVVAGLGVNFLKFQNLGFLAIYFGRVEDEDSEAPIAVEDIKLIGRV